VIDLARRLEAMRPVLKSSLGEAVTLELDLDDEAWPIEADVHELELAVLNLAVNARDAMARGGRLTIETRNADLDEAYARDHASVVPGRYVLLAISDNRIHVGVRENVVRPEVSNDRGSEPATRHLDFSDREIDSCRQGFSAHLHGVRWKVTPAIPLNPANRSAFGQYEVHVNRLVPVDGRTILRFEAPQVETLIPPDRHVRSGEPLLQQREVRPPELAE